MVGLELAFMVVGTIVRAPHKPARFGLTVRNCRRSWDYRVPQDRRLTGINLHSGKTVRVVHV